MVMDEVSLKEYLEALLAEHDKRNRQRFNAQEKTVSAALEATKQAINKADEASKESITKSEIAVEKRSDAVYVTLSKLSDSLSAVMPRAEAEQRFAALSEKIDLLKSSNDMSTGEQVNVGKIYAAVAAAGAVLAIIFLIANNVFG